MISLKTKCRYDFSDIIIIQNQCSVLKRRTENPIFMFHAFRSILWSEKRSKYLQEMIKISNPLRSEFTFSWFFYDYVFSIFCCPHLHSLFSVFTHLSAGKARGNYVSEKGNDGEQEAQRYRKHRREGQRPANQFAPQRIRVLAIRGMHVLHEWKHEHKLHEWMLRNIFQLSINHLIIWNYK